MRGLVAAVRAMAVVSVLALGATGRAVAQSPSPDSAALVESGVRVRVRAPLHSARWVTGRLARADADSVTVDVPERALVPIPRWQVERMQVSKSVSRGPGAVRGLLIGALVAGVAMSVSLPNGPPDRTEFQGLAVTASGILGGMIGAGMGAVVGVRRWHDVPLPAASLRTSPAVDGRPGEGAEDGVVERPGARPDS